MPVINENFFLERLAYFCLLRERNIGHEWDLLILHAWKQIA